MHEVRLKRRERLVTKAHMPLRGAMRSFGAFGAEEGYGQIWLPGAQVEGGNDGGGDSS